MVKKIFAVVIAVLFSGSAVLFAADANTVTPAATKKGEMKAFKQQQKSENKAFRATQKSENKALRESLKGTTGQERAAAIAAHKDTQKAENQAFKAQQKAENAAEKAKIKPVAVVQ